MQNKGNLVDLLNQIVNGRLRVEPKDFDFTCPQLQFVVERSADELQLYFQIEASPDLRIYTSIQANEFNLFSNSIKTIKDPTIRMQVVKCLEDNLQIMAFGDMSVATDEVALAQSALDDAKDVHTQVCNITATVKQEWGIK